MEMKRLLHREILWLAIRSRMLRTPTAERERCATGFIARRELERTRLLALPLDSIPILLTAAAERPMRQAMSPRLLQLHRKPAIYRQRSYPVAAQIP